MINLIKMKKCITTIALLKNRHVFKEKNYHLMSYGFLGIMSCEELRLFGTVVVISLDIGSLD